jgi:hypothetical protein
MWDRTNDYFILLDDNTIDTNIGTVKLFWFIIYTENWYYELHELDEIHAHSHWDLSRTTSNGYIWGMITEKEAIYIKEYPFDSIKVSEVVRSKKGDRY